MTIVHIEEGVELPLDLICEAALGLGVQTERIRTLTREIQAHLASSARCATTLADAEKRLAREHSAFRHTAKHAQKCFVPPEVLERTAECFTTIDTTLAALRDARRQTGGPVEAATVA